MKKVCLLLILKWGLGLSEEEKNVQDLQTSDSDKVYYQYITPAVPFSDSVGDSNQQTRSYGYNVIVPSNLPSNQHHFQSSKADSHHNGINESSLLAALLLSTYLRLPTKPATANHPDLVPINPYIALLLSHYGKYLPHQGTGRGLYGYIASNNYHNNMPFGSYKVYEPYAR
ncbi:hypothetical protein NQ318_017093 [Aromia moschata]|uniref:Uncharacterized protein n=1 Tax=Aromia moschata TaxID=1265417 RepID=A0AAV8Y6B7_9CUCU|nr:hypothetical protein NQ318_017093 [Aromia moschata]